MKRSYELINMIQFFVIDSIKFKIIHNLSTAVVAVHKTSIFEFLDRLGYTFYIHLNCEDWIITTSIHSNTLIVNWTNNKNGQICWVGDVRLTSPNRIRFWQNWLTILYEYLYDKQLTTDSGWIQFNWRNGVQLQIGAPKETQLFCALLHSSWTE